MSEKLGRMCERVSVNHNFDISNCYDTDDIINLVERNIKKLQEENKIMYKFIKELKGNGNGYECSCGIESESLLKELEDNK